MLVSWILKFNKWSQPTQQNQPRAKFIFGAHERAHREPIIHFKPCTLKFSLRLYGLGHAWKNKIYYKKGIICPKIIEPFLENLFFFKIKLYFIKIFHVLHVLLTSWLIIISSCKLWLEEEWTFHGLKCQLVSNFLFFEN